MIELVVSELGILLVTFAVIAILFALLTQPKLKRSVINKDQNKTLQVVEQEDKLLRIKLDTLKEKVSTKKKEKIRLLEELSKLNWIKASIHTDIEGLKGQIENLKVERSNLRDSLICKKKEVKDLHDYFSELSKKIILKKIEIEKKKTKMIVLDTASLAEPHTVLQDEQNAILSEPHAVSQDEKDTRQLYNYFMVTS